MHITVVLSLIFAAITVNNSENKFTSIKIFNRDSRNNSSRSQGSEHTDPIKAEIKKFLPECGAETSDEDSSEYHKRNSTGFGDRDNYDYNSRRYGDNGDQRRNQNHGSYGNWYGGSPNNDGGYGSNNGYGNSRSDSGNWNNRNHNNNNMGYNNSDYGNYNGNRGYTRGSQDYGTRRTSSDGYGKTGSMSGRRSDYDSGAYGSSSGSFGYRGSYVRTKRSDEDTELDDNRSPSESALIKWFQDHLPNDGKRIKSLRDTRRCFGQLAASDNDDGCAFSKSLSRCLNLDMEN